MKNKQVLFSVLLCLGLFSASAFSQSFTFVALGDLPYGPDATAGARYRTLITKINQLKPSFSIHVGDFKDGQSICSDEVFALQKKYFDSFESALIYTPGDNEWTDCNRLSNGSYDPLERLDKLRTLFFRPDLSLGQTPIALTNQPRTMPRFSTYVENQRWQQSKTLFVTVHIVGSNNRFDPVDPRAQAEFLARDSANIAWIKDAFELAHDQDFASIVFAFQADVLRQDVSDVKQALLAGFETSIGETLLPEAAKFKKPVLIIHGDTHRFKFDQIFSVDVKDLNNVYRLEVPGDKVIGAVVVKVDERAAQPFTAQEITVQ